MNFPTLETIVSFSLEILQFTESISKSGEHETGCRFNIRKMTKCCEISHTYEKTCNTSSGDLYIVRLLVHLNIAFHKMDRNT